MKYLQAAGTVLILAAVHRLYMHDLVGMFLIGIAAHQCFIHQKMIDLCTVLYTDGVDVVYDEREE